MRPDILNPLFAEVETLKGELEALKSEMQAQKSEQANTAAQVMTTQSQVQDVQAKVAAVPAVTSDQVNTQIRNASSGGDSNSGLLDQRDTALTNLAQIMDIKTTPNADGSVSVSTADGVNLVSNTYAQLSYSGGGTDGNYSQIMMSNMSGTGQQIGQPQELDSHQGSGSLAGLVDMRDNQLPSLQAGPRFWGRGSGTTRRSGPRASARR